jgi:hypothetical protein
MYNQETLLKILAQISLAATELQVDQLSLQAKTALEVNRYNEGKISLEEAGFWHKGLVRAFLAQIDGLCSAMRMAVVQNAPALGLTFSRKDDRDLAKTGRLSLDRNVVVAFRNFPKLFGSSYNFDNSGMDFRGFRAMLQARERFTHPKSYRDLCPFEIFPTTSSSIEWLYGNFRQLLTSCVSSIGLSLKDSGTPIRRFAFQDESLVKFEEARVRYDAERTEGEFIGHVRDITLALWKDTKLSLEFISEAFRPDSGVSPDCAVRNFVRTFFSEVEGCVFVAAFSLHRFRDGYPEPTEELLIGSHKEVRERIVSTLESFSREFGADVVIVKEGSEWEDFLVARELRNRLTHPRVPSDLALRPEDMDMTLRASSWWHNSVNGCFELNGQKLP